MNVTSIVEEQSPPKHWRVRRLTPTECMRLQAWPDGWTAKGLVDKVVKKGPDKGKTVQEVVTIADGPQYRMAGNGVTADVAHWAAYRYFREFELAVENFSKIAA